MPTFGKTSNQRLDTCHTDLQVIAHEVIKVFDFSVICGHRNQTAQMLAYESGKSQVNWPNSRHNTYPSMALDVSPYPIDWNDTGAFYLLVGYFQLTAQRLLDEGRITHRLRSGADWNGNHKTKDQKFHDLPHHELV
jgi:peptidoglycan LD-endopeptidase CwlK